MNEIENALIDDMDGAQFDFVCRSIKDIFRNKSVDTNDSRHHEFPILSNYKAIDFDNIKIIYVNNRRIEENDPNISFCSNDALLLSSSNELFFVECKDGKITSKLIKEIENKIYDSNLIFEELSYLNEGFLIIKGVDGIESYLDRERKPDFNLAKRLEKKGILNHQIKARQYVNYCLIYNASLYEETQEDREYYRNNLNNVIFAPFLQFLDSYSTLLGEIDSTHFLLNCLEKRNGYPLFSDVLTLYENINQFLIDNKLLIDYFDDQEQQLIFIGELNSLLRKYKSIIETNKVMTGKEFVIFLNLFSNLNKSVVKRLEQLHLELKTQESKEERVYDKQLYRILSKLSLPKGKPRKLFNLQRFEGKYYKNVYTIDEKEFLGFMGIEG